MNNKAKLDSFQSELMCSIKFFAQKHKRTKRRAQMIKISSIGFSGLITVVLGLTASENMTDLFRNIALVLGSVVTIINAVDAFFNYNALWIKSTVTLSKLQELRRKLEFYTAGTEPEQISEIKLNEFLDELQQILKDDMKQWLRIREKVNSLEHNKENNGFIDLKLRSRADVSDITADPNETNKAKQ